MTEQSPRILVVDDSQQDLRIHASTLRAQGYDVVTATGGEEALLLIEGGIPDLFLIDAGLQGMDGYTLCERIKEDGRLLNIPVIFITRSRAPEDIDRGYTAGAVDYIVKPCHLSEFLARVRTHLSLYRLLREVQALREAAIDDNPLTHLPGNNTIVQRIQEALDNYLDVAIIYVDLDNFKAYNDAYGFSDGDDVILFTAETLQTVLRVVCEGKGFLGHIGGDDFVVIVPASVAQQVGDEIVKRFDRGAPAFYNDEDRERGCIVAEGRRGEIETYPFLSISMGGMVLRRRQFTRYVEVATVCAEVKHAAKSVPGSNLFMDRRTGDRRAGCRRRLDGQLEEIPANEVQPDPDPEPSPS